MLGLKNKLVSINTFSLPLCGCVVCAPAKEQREIVEKSESLRGTNPELYSLNFGESRDWRSIVEKLVDGK